MMDAQEELIFMSEACEDSYKEEIEYEYEYFMDGENKWSSRDEEPQIEVKNNDGKSIQRTLLNDNNMFKSDFAGIKGSLAKESMMDERSRKDPMTEGKQGMHLKAFRHEGIKDVQNLLHQMGNFFPFPK
ncbi:hypothetical protein KI387_008179, partial [Taxus chinensis]